MSKIAILDTAISPTHLHCQEFHIYNVCGGDAGPVQENSHGTICARVLDYFTSGYALFQIQILEDGGKTAGKPMGDIRHLKKGLQLCLDLDVDIVCMSAVSSILSDSGILYETVRRLAQKSALVAALDNRRYVTVPTAYPFVTGVQAAALCSMDAGTDVRFRKRSLDVDFKQELLFMECCYKTDLFFLVIEKEERDHVMAQADADLEILLDGDSVRILYEDGCAKGCAGDLADLVYGIRQYPASLGSSVWSWCFYPVFPLSLLWVGNICPALAVLPAIPL